MDTEIIVQVPLSGFLDTLIFFGAMAISTLTVLWFLWEVTIKEKDYGKVNTVALEKSHEIKHRKTHDQ
jgi:hypothetical protein